MENHPLPRLDKDAELRDMLLPFCRFEEGDIYVDKLKGHKIACLDSTLKDSIKLLTGNQKVRLALHDPPYNFIAFDELEISHFITFCRKWIDNSDLCLDENSSLYIWLGADQKNNFAPLPQFLMMMNEFKFKSRSWITMRNQRGYGTQKNWMAVRQELLYYTKGNPEFNIDAEYTEIPKILRGYYKQVGGALTENIERSKSSNIRAGNVWVDIQQVFYKMQENVNGCFAQKPLKSVERIISSSTGKKDIVVDFFAHSGSTLIASEISNRICFTTDIDPIYCEICLRRLENLRNSEKTGWQNSNPFYYEIIKNKKIKRYLKTKYNIDYADN